MTKPAPAGRLSEDRYLSFDEPLWRQHEHCIKILMAQTPMPNSLSVFEAMKQLIRDVRHIDEQRAALSAGRAALKQE